MKDPLFAAHTIIRPKIFPACLRAERLVAAKLSYWPIAGSGSLPLGIAAWHFAPFCSFKVLTAILAFDFVCAHRHKQLHTIAVFVLLSKACLLLQQFLFFCAHTQLYDYATCNNIGVSWSCLAKTAFCLPLTMCTYIQTYICVYYFGLFSAFES